MQPAAEANVKVLLPCVRFAAMALAITLTGCALAPTTHPGDAESLFQDAQFRRPAEPVDSKSVFAFDDTMRRFLAREIAPQVHHKDPRQALLDALSGRLRIDYDPEMTRTASQAFAARKGNCLSLVIMAAAFAKQLGLRVTYQEVYGFDTWSRDAGIAFLSQHVNLVLGWPEPRHWPETSADTPMIVDFVPARQVAGAVTKPVPEQTIIAMYMNNRAAEVLAGGDLDRAYWFARAALEADPMFVDAANTLGVIYWRRNQLAHSERALRYTLEREPGNVPALSNLVHVLDAEGRTAESQSVAKKLAEVQRHPPFYFYDLGVKALNAGDFELAARQFRKALSRRPYDDQSHFGLALAALHLGDVPRARRELEVALHNSTTHEQRAVYAAKLRHLQSFR